MTGYAKFARKLLDRKAGAALRRTRLLRNNVHVGTIFTLSVVPPIFLGLEIFVGRRPAASDAIRYRRRTPGKIMISLSEKARDDNGYGAGQ
jgi:hypothetical protein